jgi:hypothetical protein
MKKTLLILTVLASLTIATYADPVQDSARIVTSNAIAVVDLKAFGYLINSLEAAFDLSKAPASFVFAESGNLIDSAGGGLNDRN